jgi:hypothetical protein
MEIRFNLVTRRSFMSGLRSARGLAREGVGMQERGRSAPLLPVPVTARVRAVRSRRGAEAAASPLEEVATVMRMLTRTVRGAVAGVAATAAMSALMVGAERGGVMPGQPPRMIVDRFAPRLDASTADTVALLMHGAYGAAAGAGYALGRGRRASAASGAVFGVLLWAAGYEGWVPVLGVLPPAHRDDRGRVLAMVLGHATYGAVLGALLARR